MVPKICTVVADCYGNSKKLTSLRQHQFILFVSEADLSGHSAPGLTLIYGYALAKKMFGNVSIGDYYINDNTRWTFNEFESKDDLYVDEWIDSTLDKFFTYDAIQGKYGDELFEQLKTTELAFLYNGNHELYLYDANKSECYSWTHEEIRLRLEIEPEALANQIANWYFAQARAVYAWDPFNLKTVDYQYENILLFIRDIAFASTNEWLTKKSVKDLVRSSRVITTPEFMKYLSHLPNIYQKLEQKDYLRRFMAGEVEQLYSNAQIYFDSDKLLGYIRLRNKTGADTHKMSKIYSKVCVSPMVQIPYMSRNKITGRMFAKNGLFNPITENDQDILDCISTRHTTTRPGAICVFDFSAFEPTIIAHVLKLAIGDDIHQKAADVLQIDREAAKKLNNMFLYGAHAKSIAVEMKSHKIEPEASSRYLQMMKPIMTAVEDAIRSLKVDYDRDGYIHSALGRIVRPRSKSGLFNNFIQTTASDLFNAVSLHVFELLRGKESKLFMHKFDAIYVDVHPAETEVIEQIVDIMANKTGINFSVKVYAGRDLGNLRVLQ